MESKSSSSSSRCPGDAETDYSLVSDETPPNSASENLKLAFEAYPLWVGRASNSEITSAFLANCLETIPFYLKGMRPGISDFAAFPIVDRSEHDANRLDFISSAFDDPRADQLEVPTNGTFGPCLRVAWDLPSMFELNHGSYLRFSTAMPDLFSSITPGEPSIFIVSDSTTDRRASIVMPFLDGTILRRLILGRDPATDAATVSYLRDSNVALLHAKPSVLSNLVDLDRVLGGHRRIRPAQIVCSGENLYPDDRARLEAWLDCRIVEAYVATEAGVLAFECEKRDGMHVMHDHLTLEVERGDGTVGATGTGQLLITNAMNWRHAFIRYRIGDRATVVRGTCSCGHDGQTITSLPGREREIYRSGEEFIAASDIAAAVDTPGSAVKQYQVAYGNDGGLILRWILQPGAATEGTASGLGARLRERLPGLKVELRRVDVINTPGGKLRRFL